MLRDGLLLEHQEVSRGKFYGIPRQLVLDCLSAGAIRIADIEVLGAQKLAAAFPHNVVQIFVTVPGDDIDAQLQVLAQRMKARADSATDIDSRLQRARAIELPYQCRCDYIVVNDQLAHAIECTQQIIARELARRQLQEAAP